MISLESTDQISCSLYCYLSFTRENKRTFCPFCLRTVRGVVRPLRPPSYTDQTGVLQVESGCYLQTMQYSLRCENAVKNSSKNSSEMKSIEPNATTITPLLAESTNSIEFTGQRTSRACRHASNVDLSHASKQEFNVVYETVHSSLATAWVLFGTDVSCKLLRVCGTEK